MVGHNVRGDEMTDIVKYDDSGTILFSGDIPESMVKHQGSNVVLGKGTSDFQYVKNGKIYDYTTEELEIKRNLPLGFIWKMPDRIAFDPRNDDQRHLDELEAFKKARAQSYPPIEELADALYWQSKGDNTKMMSYLAACEAVKQKIPKKE